MRAHLLVGLLLALALAEKPEEDLRVIQLSVGDLQGRQVTTKDGKTVYAYLGIPYANAPIGDLRFKAPETKRKWDGVLDATEYKVSCPYNSTFISDTHESKFMSEDCLQVNVFASEHCLKKGGCPVLVYLFPSDFYFGSAVMIEERRVAEDWAAHDLVVVTFNHRLGIFGLLNLGTETDAAADAALLDQVAALRWTQKHIDKFGADARHVTLMSVGSGAANADLLALSPKTKGLFGQLVLIDGAAGLYNNSDRETNERSSKNIAVKIGCSTIAGWGKKEKATNTLKCLREHRAGELLEVQRELEDYLERVPFDGPAVTRDGVLTKKVDELQKKRRAMPVLLGSTARLPTTKDTQQTTTTSCAYAATFKNLSKSRKVIKECQKMYRHDEEEAVDEVTVNLPLLETSRRNTENGGKTYLFETHSAFDENLHLTDRAENTRLKETIVRFLKTGDPSDEDDKTQWKPFDTEKANYLKMHGRKTENAEGYHDKANDFWNHKVLEMLPEKGEEETEEERGGHKKTETEEERRLHKETEEEEEEKKHRGHKKPETEPETEKEHRHHKETEKETEQETGKGHRGHKKTEKETEEEEHRGHKEREKEKEHRGHKKTEKETEEEEEEKKHRGHKKTETEEERHGRHKETETETEEEKHRGHKETEKEHRGHKTTEKETEEEKEHRRHTETEKEREEEERRGRTETEKEHRRHTETEKERREHEKETEERRQKTGEEKWKMRNMTKEEVLETVGQMQKEIHGLRDRLTTDEEDISEWKEDVEKTLKTLQDRMEHVKKHKPTTHGTTHRRHEKTKEEEEEDWEPKGRWKVQRGKWTEVKGKERQQVLRQVAEIERDIAEIFEEFGLEAPKLLPEFGARNENPAIIPGNLSDPTVPSVVVYRDAGWNLWFWIVFALFVVLLVVLMITCFFLVTAKQKKGEYSQIS